MLGRLSALVLLIALGLISSAPAAASSNANDLVLRFVPEPGTLVVVGSGIVGLAAVSRWRKRRRGR